MLCELFQIIFFHRLLSFGKVCTYLYLPTPPSSLRPSCALSPITITCLHEESDRCIYSSSYQPGFVCCIHAIASLVASSQKSRQTISHIIRLQHTRNYANILSRSPSHNLLDIHAIHIAQQPHPSQCRARHPFSQRGRHRHHRYSRHTCRHHRHVAST